VVAARNSKEWADDWIDFLKWLQSRLFEIFYPPRAAPSGGHKDDLREFCVGTYMNESHVPHNTLARGHMWILCSHMYEWVKYTTYQFRAQVCVNSRASLVHLHWGAFSVCACVRLCEHVCACVSRWGGMRSVEEEARDERQHHLDNGVIFCWN